MSSVLCPVSSQKSTLSVSSINEILSSIPEEIKLLYNKQWIEQAYLDYQNRAKDDTEALQQLKVELEAASDKPVLIIGPGNTVKEQKKGWSYSFRGMIQLSFL